MAQDIQAGVYDSVRALFARRKPEHTLPIGAPCPNCGAKLAGPWCHDCGQSSEEFHRSIGKLAAEAAGGLFELDGRMWRTLPDLVRNPGRLTRSYLEGHRASQAPPFRMFLIVVVMIFLVAGLGSGMTTRVDLSQPGGAIVTRFGHTNVSFRFLNAPDDPTARWVASRLKAAAPHAEALQTDLIELTEHLAFLMLPLAAALMGLMFFWRRGVYVFDHLIFSMHSLTFQGALVSFVILAGKITDWALWLLVLAPVHLFAHMKGTYHLGVFSTLARMVVLSVGSFLGFLLIATGVMLAGLYEVGR